MEIVLFILLGFLLLSLAIVLIVGSLNPDFDYVAKLDIEKPLEKVFQYYANDDNMSHWVTGFESFKKLNDKEGEEGAKSELVIRSGSRKLRMENTIYKYLPNDRVCFWAENSSFALDSRYQFYRVSKLTTRVVNINIMKPKGTFQRGIMTLIKKGLQKQAQKDLENLKRQLESA